MRTVTQIACANNCGKTVNIAPHLADRVDPQKVFCTSCGNAKLTKKSI